MGVRKIFHAPTFGQETGDGPDSLVLKGRRAGAGHTAPFDLMHPERIRAKEMGKWCGIGKRRSLSRVSAKKENVQG